MMVNILFWIFVSAFTLLVPGVMIFFGREFMKNPPSEINPGYGYRTSMSSTYGRKEALSVLHDPVYRYDPDD